MKHRKHDQIPFGLDVVDIIQNHVNTIASEQWKADECPPLFMVSLNNENMDNQMIMITINHCRSKFTEKLFPRKDTEYGYDSVLNQMINMYNQTI